MIFSGLDRTTDQSSPAVGPPPVWIKSTYKSLQRIRTDKSTNGHAAN